MKKYEDIPLRIEHHAKSRQQLPQTFDIPRGCEYKTDFDDDYRHAFRDFEIELFLSGEWVEIVHKEKMLRIRYRID